MPVFENLRNFIRHGKQAQEEKSKPNSVKASGGGSGGGSLSDSACESVADSGTESAPDAAPGSAPGSAHGSARNSKIDPASQPRNHGHTPVVDAAKQLVQEDLENSRKMPSYNGIDNYILLDKMGDGAFSVVYKALERRTREKAAIKVVKKTGLSSSQRAAVLKEAAIMRQLDHPNIVGMKAFKETPDHYFIILELVPGGELFHQIVRLTYFSEDLSRHVILQVAHAIRYLHEEAGVVHRDIKPENLLFSPAAFLPSKHRVFRDGDDESKEDEGEFTPGVGGGGIGTIKLADFGLSKVIWDSKTMTPCGTVGYTAPEIVKDEKYSKNVDMWALGCVLYTILCGFPPFYDESIDVLTRKVAKGEYTFLSPWWDDISPGAKDLVSQLLTVDPRKRLTIDEFLGHPWVRGNEAKISAEALAHTQHLPQGARSKKDPARGGALRDAFDVSNAVYRMEQDTREKHTDAILEEEEELEAHMEALSLDARERERQRATRHAPTGGQFFDLHLEGATLLERRRKNALAA